MSGTLKTIGIGFIATLVSLLLSVPIWLVYSGVIVVGGLTDNPAVKWILLLVVTPISLWIAGYAAITAVKVGRGR